MIGPHCAQVNYEARVQNKPMLLFSERFTSWSGNNRDLAIRNRSHHSAAIQNYYRQAVLYWQQVLQVNFFLLQILTADHLQRDQ